MKLKALVWLLWVFNFGTTNSEIMFMNKKHDDSKMNLRRLKDIREALPSYLQMTEMRTPDGKIKKASNNVESTTNIINGNKITTKAGARNANLANSLGRGCTMPIHWYDEYAFILYNSVIYSAATPAFKTAADNAKRNGAPYGILITTTPGDMTTDEGLDAYKTKESATMWNEAFYDFDMNKLTEVKNSNTSSTFFYIRYTYQQLGSDSQYFKEMVLDLKKDWVAIRREVLLEWSKSSSNSPFKQQDLDQVERLIMSEPIKQIPLMNGLYFLNLYKPMDVTMSRAYPPIIGVDVSGGYSQDSSTITIIDSRTTEVVADFNCNYISTNDLAKVIYEIVIKYLPNAIVNVERNGGFGASVLSTLVKSKIKRNLYFEIKDRVMEERFNGVKVVKSTQKVKVYGLDQTKSTRELLMEILKDRMEYHKAKFISPIIFNELVTLEVKKNGRIEHADNAHDDQIFSYLIALYVWYEGKNLMENFGLDKTVLHTDNEDEVMLGLEETYQDIVNSIEMDEETDLSQQIEYLNSDSSVSYKEWEEQQFNEDQKALEVLLRNKRYRQAYARMNHMDPDSIEQEHAWTNLPDKIFYEMNDDESEDQRSDLQKEFDNIIDLR
ncbi:MAG: hypothetical protein PHC62_00225 [Candidatus Izemoplasmatales bacterium]|nr:hypothetical protein [Candidatus Izemoplasmatales bacterium]